MPNEWKKSLDGYRYCAKMKKYENADNYTGFFELSLPTGDRCETASFETRFRELAATKIEVWLEVIFWKLYSQANRRNSTTNQVAEYFQRQNVSPYSLLKACNDYIENDTQTNLDAIRKLLGFRSRAIATAATFPAFLRPDLFPMVDTRIAKWVGNNMKAHNNANPNAPQLVRPRYLDNAATVLTLADFKFVYSWNRWCRYKANQLNECTSINWRPRDVEMAVFNAWSNKGQQHPIIQLEILL